ncbi:uncharacterized protein LOC110101801, partial [Dendrobium catenatum]|uniref:uncharacterized protein LOC110101801 n=1 Tax=Dendrobium catenatum TaxID=906689 RepID=UPI00109FAC37
DILITGSHTSTLEEILQRLRSEFKLKQLGDISLYLGIQVIKNPSGYFLSQAHYAQNLLSMAGFSDCKPSPSPTSPRLPKNPDNQPFDDPHLFRKLAGSLQYLSITRPDIAFATNNICQHMHAPRNSDYTALKHLLRYLKGTIDFGLPIAPGALQLRCYTDADWAADVTDRKSVSGFCTFLGPNLISWSVKKQNTVARSSTEAEYRSLSAATSDVLWIRRLANDLGIPQTSPTTIHCDNISAIALANNPIFHARTKHIEIDHHFILGHLQQRHISIAHIYVSDVPSVLSLSIKDGPSITEDDQKPGDYSILLCGAIGETKVLESLGRECSIAPLQTDHCEEKSNQEDGKWIK